MWKNSRKEIFNMKHFFFFVQSKSLNLLLFETFGSSSWLNVLHKSRSIYIPSELAWKKEWIHLTKYEDNWLQIFQSLFWLLALIILLEYKIREHTNGFESTVP